MKDGTCKLMSLWHVRDHKPHIVLAKKVGGKMRNVMAWRSSLPSENPTNIARNMRCAKNDEHICIADISYFEL